MSRYILRLDDASDFMDLEKWLRMEEILDKYKIKPIFGIIPKNKDESLLSKYDNNPDFWELVHRWIDKGWIPAMHGYEHRYVTEDGGINPVNKRSEFAGLLFDEQAGKIRDGYRVLYEHSVSPEIFFAPSHTFDENTLKAIREETPIRIISDTVAWDIYKEGEFWFIPQQSGQVRKLPFRTVTFCYHPNTMSDEDYHKLELFIKNNHAIFVTTRSLRMSERKKSLLDKVLQWVYYKRH